MNITEHIDRAERFIEKARDVAEGQSHIEVVNSLHLTAIAHATVAQAKILARTTPGVSSTRSHVSGVNR